MQVHKDTIDKVVFTFVRERRHDKMALEFLTSLCSFNGKQVRNNQVCAKGSALVALRTLCVLTCWLLQTYIGQLMQKEENRPLFITTSIEGNRLQLSWSWPSEDLHTVWLDEVLDDGNPDASSDLYDFYLAQIMLFSEM